MRTLLVIFTLFAFPLTSITLEEAETHALAHNRSILAFRELVRQGRYKQFQAWSKWWPQITLQGDLFRTDVGSNLGYRNRTSSVLNFDQQIFNVPDYYDIQLSKVEREQAEMDLHDLENDVLFETRTGFYKVILSQEQIKVEEENIANLVDAAKQEENKLEVGDTTEFDVNRAKVAVTNAQSDLYQARRQLRVDRTALLELLGMAPNEDIVVPKSEVKIDEIQELFDLVRTFKGDTVMTDERLNKWEEQVMQNNFDVRRQELVLLAARKELHKRGWAYAPTAKVFSRYKNTGRVGPLFLSRISYWEMGGSVNFTLFDGMNREYRIKEAQSEQERQLVEYDRILLTTRRALYDRFYVIDESIQKFMSAEQGVKLASEAIDLAKNRRDLGFITPLEFRDTVASHTEARQTFNEAAFELIKSYYALQQLAGMK